MGQQKVLVASKEDVFAAINSGAAATSRPLLIALIALGGTFVDAYDFTALGIGALQLKTQFHLTSFELGSLTASMAFGALLGALIGGYFTDKIGRFKMFALDLILFVVSAIAAALAPNLVWLIVFRLLMGFGVGLDFPVALSFVAEFSSTNRKSRLVQGWQTMWYSAATIGFLLLLGVHFLGVNADLWRYAVGFGALPALIVLVLRYRYMDESPMWLASCGDLHGAVKVLNKSYGMDAEVAMGLQSNVATMPTHTVSPLRAEKVLFTPRYRPRTILAGVIGFTQSMEYFALGFYLPTIIGLLFGKNLNTVLWASALFNVFGIVGALINLATTNRLGLRRMCFIGYSGVILVMGSIGIFGHGAPATFTAVALIVFIGLHSYGQGSAGMSMGALSYPTAIRGIGAGFTQSIIRVGSISGFYFFPVVVAAYGLYHTTLLLMLVPIAGLIVTMIIKWEPVGKNIEEEEVDLDRALAAGERTMPMREDS